MALAGVGFPPVDAPVASLIVVVHGQLELATRTLASLARGDEPAFEVIVVDSGSPDGAGSRLAERVQGARFVLSARNIGYGSAVDLGALEARGRYLAALNSDLEVQPGWLRHLVDALETDPSAGVAGPMLLGPGGDVQEAGVLLGPQGTGYGYGDTRRPGDPELSFRRYVDYVSGAALLVRRDVFDAVGGFDPIYGSGYYEDADLCFAARDCGFRTVYQPRARVTHIGQGSFDPDHRRRQVARNRPVFVQRYAEQLAGRPALSRPPFDPHRDLVLRDWWCPQRFLVVGTGEGLGRLASAIQDRRPDSRVTWIAGGGGGAGDDRIERFAAAVDLRRWLEARRFHYSAVVCPAQPPAALGRALARSQPQALVCPVPEELAGTGAIAAWADRIVADGDR